MLPLSFSAPILSNFSADANHCEMQRQGIAMCFDNSLLFIFDFSDLFDQAALILPTDTTH